MHCSQLCMPSRYSFPSNGPSLPPSLPSPPQRTEITSCLCHNNWINIWQEIYNSPFGIRPCEGTVCSNGVIPLMWKLVRQQGRCKILHSVLQHFVSKEAFEHSKIQNSLRNSILWNLNTVSSLLTFRKTWNEVAGFWVTRLNNRAGRKGAVCTHVLSLTVLWACQSRVVSVKLGIQKLP